MLTRLRPLAFAAVILPQVPFGAAAQDARILPDTPVSICERVGDEVLLGSGFGGAFRSHVLREATEDFAADCDPARRPDSDRFLGEESYRCLHSGTNAVISYSRSDEVGETMVLRRSSDGDEMADCAPAFRDGDRVLNEDRAEPSFAVALVGDLLFYETSTGPQGGLTLYDLTDDTVLAQTEEGVGVELTQDTFLYYDRLAEAAEGDCPADRWAELMAGAGAAGLYVLRRVDVATGEVTEGETACLSEQ